MQHPLHGKVGKRLGKVGIPRNFQISHLQIFENVKICISRMLKLEIFGKAGNVLDRYRKAGKAWELVPEKAGKPIISKSL